MPSSPLRIHYPVTLSFLPDTLFSAIRSDNFSEHLTELVKEHRLPEYLPDLSRLELVRSQVMNSSTTPNHPPDRWCVNPTLEILHTQWAGLADLFTNELAQPTPRKTTLLVYQHSDGTVKMIEADGHDLLALKIVSEQLDKRDVAATAETTVEHVAAILQAALGKGLIFRPPSGIRRCFAISEGTASPEDLVEIFTLQWHLTQRCDLHCRHCYDRSERREVSYDDACEILDQFYEFCEVYHVNGQVSFTGGNPFLHPRFAEIYSMAVSRGFLTAILGNPVHDHMLEEVIRIRKPEYIQVSLEGLQPHNDYIRGKGHFSKTLSFLELLKRKNIHSLVMLTLTRANRGEVLQLAEFLRDKVDGFNFNRLSQVGEGASLDAVAFDEYETFLTAYQSAARTNPVMGLKDNLFNILRERENAPLTGGCTGYGCGAAFNFVSLLPDGEVHACRKMPSKIGTLQANNFIEIFAGTRAQNYRRGSSACTGCPIRYRCRGCPAVVYDGKSDIFAELDPYCFRP